MAVNVGGGLADLVLLPMQDWQREGRLLRGLKEGAVSLLHATALEGARIGTRLAVGTQVILEHVDDIFEPGAEDTREGANRSRYADPPESLQEGLLTAYNSLSSSLADGLHTIIAVPVQVYERNGPEGALKAAIRAVPVAILKPAIGASEAISRTLMGVESALDPGRGIDIKRKYK
jgi:autophagy-related protein 2